MELNTNKAVQYTGLVNSEASCAKPGTVALSGSGRSQELATVPVSIRLSEQLVMLNVADAYDAFFNIAKPGDVYAMTRGAGFSTEHTLDIMATSRIVVVISKEPTQKTLTCVSQPSDKNWQFAAESAARSLSINTATGGLLMSDRILKLSTNQSSEEIGTKPFVGCDSHGGHGGTQRSIKDLAIDSVGEVSIATGHRNIFTFTQNTNLSHFWMIGKDYGFTNPFAPLVDATVPLDEESRIDIDTEIIARGIVGLGILLGGNNRSMVAQISRNAASGIGDVLSATNQYSSNKTAANALYAAAMTNI